MHADFHSAIGFNTIMAGVLSMMVSGATAQSSDRDRDLAAADHLRQLGQTAEALAAYRKLVEQNSNDPSVLKAAAVAAGRMQELRTSVSWFQRLKTLNPVDISTREALLVGYSALNDTTAFDAERADLIHFWRETSDSLFKSRGFFIREVFRVQNHEVGAFECFEWQGRLALKYIFRIIAPTAKTEYWITMGSYYERQKFHIDIYQGSTHSLIWMSEDEPSYVVVRDRVLQAIEDNSVSTGKHVILSSFRPDRRSYSPSNTCQLGAN